MSEWSLCARCKLVPGRPHDEDAGTFLCDDCARRVDELGEAAESLGHTLMHWGRDQEWRGVDPDVLLEAAGLAFALFEARLLSGGSLAGSPQLLHAGLSDDSLELTLANDPTSVWQESFGSLESRHRRVPFLLVSQDDGSPLDLTLHFWDKRDKFADSIDFWTGDEQVLAELAAATETRRWGVPWNVVEVGGLKESSAGAVEDLCEIVGALGFFPATGGRDAARGTATIELAGDLNEVARELLVETITQSFACDARSVKIRAGRYASKDRAASRA